MLEYLSPKDGPVFQGLEHKEVVYAKDQPEYIPLRVLVSAGTDKRVISRWRPTDEQRRAIANGEDIYLELSTFGQPLQPIRMFITDDNIDKDWVKVCLLDETLPGAKQEKLCPMEPAQ